MFTDVVEQQMAGSFKMAVLFLQDVLGAFDISFYLWTSSRDFGVCDAYVQYCTSHYEQCDTYVGTR